MPNEGSFRQIKKSVRALLTISELLCVKSGLQRYQLGSDEMSFMLSPQKLPSSSALIDRSTISLSELKECGIELSDIEPFLLRLEVKETMIERSAKFNYLDRCPLVMKGNAEIVVALPSALSVAIRDYVISHIIEGNSIQDGLIDIFDSMLAKNYANLLSTTPLLGGPLRAPVRWKKSGEHRWTTFPDMADKGYYISYHFFLPSAQTHIDGSFRVEHQIEDELIETLQESISNSMERVMELPDFKEGLVILVGCGWGTGHAFQIIEPNHPKWRFESMSAADLVRLSWLDDMNPQYFWRIQDGLEAITNAGVQIINPNGILNLIGWVRKNDGHYVPHGQLLGERISPENPLILKPPFNLLREVRANSDQGYDRHCLADNTGTLHEIQRVEPNPSFRSRKSRRIFASIDDLDHEIFTSVYEGALHLWVSIIVPNITQKAIEHQLWKWRMNGCGALATFLMSAWRLRLRRAILKSILNFVMPIPRNF